MVFFVLSSTEKYVTLISGSNLSQGVMWSQDGNHKDESEEKQGGGQSGGHGRKRHCQ